MASTLASLLLLWAIASPGDLVSLSPPAATTPSLHADSLGIATPAMVATPWANPGHSSDILFESDLEEEDDVPTDDALFHRGWTFRVTIAATCSGVILSSRALPRSFDRSPILRC